MLSVPQILVQRYKSEYKKLWDNFVSQSKNGVFLFYRDYLEYHADRFDDCSLIFFQGESPIALLPANRVENTIISHGGLTFGGIISDARMGTSLMLDVFAALIDELRKQGVTKLVYKAIPHMYHLQPAEEDLYSLFVHNARLVRRDVSSAVIAAHRPTMTHGRKKTLKHARALGLKVERSYDFAQFMAIAAESLNRRHGLRPVHTADEMQLLASRFPENIKLFALHRGQQMLGGVIIYESQNVAHGQYRHATEEGMDLGAFDCLMDVLMNEVYVNKPYIDFGISMADGGRTLNAGLVRNKESYGARTLVYDFYELDIKSQ